MLPSNIDEIIEEVKNNNMKWENGQKIKVIENGKINKHNLVSACSEYMNINNIEYNTFKFNDLKEYIK